MPLEGGGGKKGKGARGRRKGEGGGETKSQASEENGEEEGRRVEETEVRRMKPSSRGSVKGGKGKADGERGWSEQVEVVTERVNVRASLLGEVYGERGERLRRMKGIEDEEAGCIQRTWTRVDPSRKGEGWRSLCISGVRREVDKAKKLILNWIAEVREGRGKEERCEEGREDREVKGEGRRGGGGRSKERRVRSREKGIPKRKQDGAEREEEQAEGGAERPASEEEVDWDGQEEDKGSGSIDKCKVARSRTRGRGEGGSGDKKLEEERMESAENKKGRKG